MLKRSGTAGDSIYLEHLIIYRAADSIVLSPIENIKGPNPRT